MATMVLKSGFAVAVELARFVDERVLPGLPIDSAAFWRGAAEVFERFAPENSALLTRRDTLQEQLDRWHAHHHGDPPGSGGYRRYLSEIGYLAPEPPPFEITPTRVDEELSLRAAPQLVVPALNARYLLNAANARWGSLYDALYGTDALGDPPPPGPYDPVRGARVIDWTKAFLDEVAPLANGSWRDWTSGDPILADPQQLIGRDGDSLLLRRHGLLLEIVVDRAHPVGALDPAGVADVRLESALTTIVDLEDSVAAVDAADKVAAYANWLGLMKGDLEDTFEKGGRSVTRRLQADRCYRDRAGAPLIARGRSLLLVRNVGLAMTTPAVCLPGGEDAPEGILDALVTTLVAMHDLQGRAQVRNSRRGSVYVVKPKLHGPDEAAFTGRLFDAVEAVLGLPRGTVKIGLMDEERRTSANLAACIHALRDRIVFVNTGFLDRTGDEVHTAMRAGPMVRKAEMKSAAWFRAYEDRNVQVALACGFAGRGQIGKGMWAAPDRMADMLAQKIDHPLSGASTAWVPSPTAATLHATHYHRVDVAAQQAMRRGKAPAPLSDLLTPALAGPGRKWSAAEIRDELENNLQGILGYVVRWVDQGVGCSKVPDIHDIGLMEDRATLRISCQLVANWLMHGVCSAAEVEDALQRMAARVDAQNAGDPLYEPMSGRWQESLSFQAAHALIFDGAAQPNGYTEAILHSHRTRRKSLAEV